MPDPPDQKAHLHPYRRPAINKPSYGEDQAANRFHGCPPYAELAVTSNFTFLRGASHPDELVYQAAQLGYEAIAMTDWNSLAGIVRAHVAAKEVKIPLIVGCRLIFTDPDWLSLLVYPTSREAYGRLCQLLTLGKRRAPKGECHLALTDFLEHQQGLLAVALLSRTASADASDTLFTLRDVFDDDRLSLAVSRLYEADDVAYVQRLSKLSQRFGIPLVAVNDVYYHVPQRRALQDVLTCVRYRCKISEAGYRLFPNGERYLKSPGEMARLFADHPRSIARTVEIAQRAAAFNLDQLRYEYADETCPPGVTPMEHLKCLTWQGANERYPNSVPEKVSRQIEHEFSLIEQLKYAPYFLTVHDLVKFARSRGILCQGRGAAANSAVCYCLGVTSVDPDRIDLLFERFVSMERNEPPDIDIDFEHERREEVIQYIYGKYGRDRAGLTAEVITYRRRSAVRDVGKALGFSLDAVDRIAKRVDSWENNPFVDSEGGDVPAQLVALGFDASNSTVRLFVALVNELVGFPRHLSQHVGGFVITRGPLCELVPIENAAMDNRTVIEWDKDDIEAMGMLKVDVLGLGMLTCIRKALELINRHEGTKAQRHEGKEIGQGGATTIPGGTKALTNKQHEKALSDQQQEKKELNHGDQDVSGFDCVAKVDGVGQDALRGYANDAGGGEIRTDAANETQRSFGAKQHCGRLRETKSSGLHSLSQNRPGVACGVGNSVDPMRADAATSGVGTDQRSIKGNRSRPSRVDQKPGKMKRDHKRASYLDSSISSFPPLCLSSPSPSCLRAFVPPCLSLASIPAEDPVVYEMIGKSDTLGVFQIESRAQMTMLPRLKPKCFYDLVIEVAIVRPGPIVGEMVHPYLRRRNGEEKVEYPDEIIRSVLGKTLGVPLFQEQVMALAIKAAGFSAGEAERLRRAITAWTSKGDIASFPTRFVEGMVRNGYDRAFAEWCFQRFKGFSQYGFPESHAASFALLVYASAWIKSYYPAVFAAALLNSQPMGFYAPAQIVRDAQEHGVEVRAIDVNDSDWDCILEDKGEALRLGMRMVQGLREIDARMIVNAVQNRGRFASPFELWRTSGISKNALVKLARADALGSMDLDRRRALWEVRQLHGHALPLLDFLPHDPSAAAIPTTPPALNVGQDYATVGLSLKAHPVSFIREQLTAMNAITAADVKDIKLTPTGKYVTVAGVVLFRQRPGTAKGVMFMTIEDETGRIDLIVRPNICEQYRDAAIYSKLVLVRGKVERLGQVLHVMARRMKDLEHITVDLPRLSRDFR